VAEGISSVRISEKKMRSEVNPDPANHNREVVVLCLDKGKGVARSWSAAADVLRSGDNNTRRAW